MLAGELREALQPVFDAADDSSSLIATRHSITLRGVAYEVPKFLLLGQRGGGKPIRIAFFAGLEAGDLPSVRALTGLLLQLKASLSHTRDYALLVYPVVNLRGFTEELAPLSDFESRFARDSADADVKFFQEEFRRWVFDGMISLRTEANSRSFHASVRAPRGRPSIGSSPSSFRRTRSSRPTASSLSRSARRSGRHRNSRSSPATIPSACMPSWMDRAPT